MKLSAFECAPAFRDHILPFLLRDEALNCVFIGVLDDLMHKPHKYPRFHLLSITDEDEIVGAAWMTPPYALGMTAMPEAALGPLLEFALRLPAVPGLVGPKSTVDALYSLWAKAHSPRVKQVMAQRFFRLETVAKAAGVRGRMRRAGPADVDLLERWTLAFARDCHLDQEQASARRLAEVAVEEGSRFFWLDGDEPVAMAAACGKTPSGTRVGWVYTPPEKRKRGYASALVARLCSQLLQEGNHFCFLATDLANPTSNHIYQEIGFRPVGDFSYYLFEREMG